MSYILGVYGLVRVFEDALTQSSPQRETADIPSAIRRTGYQFEIRLVEPGSYEIQRSRLRKVPLVRIIH